MTTDAKLTFLCPGCEREVPYENGACDDMPELCDDCWLHVTDVREELDVNPFGL
jgi:hypothetical protein